jgi:type VII secretion-associated serine protease mycosin
VAAGALAATAVAVPVLPAPASAAPAPKPNPRQWYLTAWQVERAVWPISQGEGVTVAIVDTGVDDGDNHPEMRGGVVLPGVDISESEVDSDGRDDVNGHGTQMGMFVAARGIGGGAAGLAPKSTILPVKVSIRLDTHKGIRWAADNGAKVINLSVGHPAFDGSCSEGLQDAIDHAIERDVVVVAAAGNDGNGANNTEEPSACPGVLAVGAVDRSDRPWAKTQRKPYVAVAAPGADVPMRDYNGNWVQTSGTSNAAAFVSGLVALVRAKFPDASAREVVQRVIATARDVGRPGHDETTGYGVIDPARALTEEVPADAPNPVFAAHDAFREDQESAERRDALLRRLPWIGGGLCVLVSVTAIGLLLFWSVRRDRRARLAAGGWARP